jgi:hypothetical protein
MPSSIACANERPSAMREGRGCKRGESRGSSSRFKPSDRKSKHRNTHHLADERNVRGMTGKGRRHGPTAVHPPGIQGTRQDGDSETQRHNILS